MSLFGNGVLGSLIGGAGGMAGIAGPIGAIGGSLIGGWMQNRGASQAASRAMGFSERMSNTAHQREVADLRAAGLNPILSANSGASSPGGVNAPVIDALTPAINSGRTNAMLRNETKLMRATVQNKAAENILTKANADNAVTSGRVLAQDERLKSFMATGEYWNALSAIENYKQNQINTQLKGLDLTRSQYSIPGAREDAKFWNETGQLGKWLRNIIAPAASSAKSLR